MSEVSRRSQIILIHEIVKYHISRFSSDFLLAPNTSSPLLKDDTHSSVGESLQNHGCQLGSKIVSRLTVSKGRIWDPNKCMVFICRELWIYLFGKQAKRLQSNSQGVYIVFSDDLYWLENLQSNSFNGEESSSKNKFLESYKKFYLSLISGIIRGSLKCLGFPSVVSGEYDKSCMFQ